MECGNRFAVAAPGKRFSRGFSLIETLVAASVVCLAVIAVVAVIRKGQEQMWIENHRRTARAIVDATLEGARFSPDKYNAIVDGTTNAVYPLEDNLNANGTTIITTQTESDVPYKRIEVRLQWVEPVGGANESVVMERWIPNIHSPNIASMASNITWSSQFEMCNCDGRFCGACGAPDACPCGSGCSPEVYFADAWSAVDGVIHARINGDWADWNSGNPWIRIQWASPHTIYKIVLYNRKVPPTTPCCYDDGATISFYNGGSPVGTSITMNSGFYRGSANPVVFFPRTVDAILIRPFGSVGYLGFSEIQVYE